MLDTSAATSSSGERGSRRRTPSRSTGEDRPGTHDLRCSGGSDYRRDPQVILATIRDLLPQLGEACADRQRHERTARHTDLTRALPTKSREHTAASSNRSRWREDAPTNMLFESREFDGAC